MTGDKSPLGRDRAEVSSHLGVSGVDRSDRGRPERGEQGGGDAIAARGRGTAERATGRVNENQIGPANRRRRAWRSFWRRQRRPGRPELAGVRREAQAAAPWARAGESELRRPRACERSG